MKRLALLLLALGSLLACGGSTGQGDTGADQPPDPDAVEAALPPDSTPDAVELADARLDAVDVAPTDATAPDGSDAEIVHGVQLVERTTAASLRVGVGLRDITPVFEAYTDVNLNQRWDEGEPFDDTNDNGALDTLYLGGMGLRQPTGVHDPLTARAIAFSFDGKVVVLVVVDALGISIKRMDGLRRRLLEALPAGVDLTAERIWVANTHTHSAPDTIGIFGPEEVLPGGGMKGSYDEAYLVQVEEQGAAAGLAALADLRDAELSVARADCGEGFVVDADLPLHTDPYVGILRAVEAGTGAGIATLVSIANHPETLWTDATVISADFPHVLRTRLEADLGGMAFYVSSNAGLMQTPAKDVPAGVERLEHIGGLYADAALAALEAATPVPADAPVSFGYATAPTELENVELYAGVQLGIAEGYKEYLYWIKKDPLCGKLGCLDLPLSVLRLGDVLTLITVPGEMVPELVTGEISVPSELGEAVLHPDAPFEPTLNTLVKTPDRFVIGLANAEVGYLFPKCSFAPSQIFSQRHGPGPNAAASVLAGYTRLFDALNATP